MTMKSLAERRIFQIADMNDRLEIVVPRPSGVIPSKAGRFKAKLLSKLSGYMTVNHLAQALILFALNGSEKRIINAKELRDMKV